MNVKELAQSYGLLTSISEEYYEGNTTWVATIGETEIFQYDLPISSWIPLKRMCRENNLKIDKLRLQFRSNRIYLPDSQESYIFYRSLLASLNHTEYFYHIGFRKDGVDTVFKYTVPSLILVETINDLQTIEERII